MLNVDRFNNSIKKTKTAEADFFKNKDLTLLSEGHT